jgi:hypothetical protein
MTEMKTAMTAMAAIGTFARILEEEGEEAAIAWAEAETARLEGEERPALRLIETGEEGSHKSRRDPR